MRVYFRKVSKLFFLIPFVAFSSEREKISSQIQTEFQVLKVHTKEGFVKGIQAISEKVNFSTKRLSFEIGIKETTKKYFFFETKKVWENQVALKVTAKFPKNLGISLWGGYTFRKSPTIFRGVIKYTPPRESRWIGGGFSWSNKIVKTEFSFNYYTVFKNSATYRWEFLPSLSLNLNGFSLKTALYLQKFHTEDFTIGSNSSKAFFSFKAGRVFKSSELSFKPYIFAGFGEKAIYSQGIFIEDEFNVAVKKEFGAGFVLKKGRFFLKWEVIGERLKMPNYVKLISTLHLTRENKSAVKSALEVGFSF